METTIGYLMAALFSLLIFYFLIKAAVKEAISDRAEYYFKMQNAYLKYLAKQAGMTTEDIEKAWNEAIKKK